MEKTTLEFEGRVAQILKGTNAQIILTAISMGIDPMTAHRSVVTYLAITALAISKAAGISRAEMDALFEEGFRSVEGDIDAAIAAQEAKATTQRH